MQAIPKRVLVHSVTYYKRLSVNEYGAITYDTGIDIYYVRLEPVKQSSLKALGEMKDDKMLLFYDYINSNPNTIVFNPLDKVVYNSQDYIVRTVANYIDHHVEVTLK